MDDETSIGVLQAIEEAGRTDIKDRHGRRRMPGVLSMMKENEDIWIESLLYSPLMVQDAVDMAVSILNGEEVEPVKIIPTTVVDRRTATSISTEQYGLLVEQMRKGLLREQPFLGKKKRKPHEREVVDDMTLEMKGYTKSFGANDVLRNVDFSLQGGEICALLGENGAGKSTLMNILGGVHHADRGEIRLDEAGPSVFSFSRRIRSATASPTSIRS